MSLANLVADRLRFPAPSAFGQVEELPPGGCNEQKSYGLSRLGLAAPTRSAGEDVAAKPPSPFKKMTFKLTREIAERLKARAAAIGQFQYALVTDAIRHHLDCEDDPIVVGERTGGEDQPEELDCCAALQAPPADTDGDRSCPPSPDTTAGAKTHHLAAIAGCMLRTLLKRTGTRNE